MRRIEVVAVALILVWAGCGDSEPQTRVCSAGDTRRCFGPGACQGAQACLPNGMGFSTCDCATVSPDASATGGAAGVAGASGSAGAGAGGSSGTTTDAGAGAGGGLSHIYSFGFGPGAHPVAMAMDAADNVYVFGVLGSSVDFGNGPITGGLDRAFVLKRSGSGAHVWARAFEATNLRLGLRLAVTGNDGIVVAGPMSRRSVGEVWAPCLGLVNTNADYGHFIARLDSSGECVWAKALMSGVISTAASFDIAADGSGNTIVTALGANELNGQPMPAAFVAKLDAAGRELWQRPFAAVTLDVDASGHIHLLSVPSMATNADFGGGPLTGDLFLVELDAAGNHVKSRGFQAPVSSSEPFPRAEQAVNEYGNVITGWLLGRAEFGGPPLDPGANPATFVASVDRAGYAHRFSMSFPSRSTDTGLLVTTTVNAATAHDSTVALCGSFSRTLKLGTELVAQGTGIDDADAYVATLAADGTVLHSRSYGGPQGDGCTGVVVDSQGALVVLGTYHQSIDFGGGVLPPNTADATESSMMFLAKLAR
jgi:hypothetical protein